MGFELLFAGDPVSVSESHAGQCAQNDGRATSFVIIDRALVPDPRHLLLPLT